jgi:hypothetical protein
MERPVVLCLDPPAQAGGLFSNACLTRIVGEKSLKFVAISAVPGRKCDQALRNFTVRLFTDSPRHAGGDADHGPPRTLGMPGE